MIDLPVFDRLIDFLFAAINLYGIIPLDTPYAYYRSTLAECAAAPFVWIALHAAARKILHLRVDAQGRKLGPDA